METPPSDPNTTLMRGLARENAELRELLVAVAGNFGRRAQRVSAVLHCLESYAYSGRSHWRVIRW